MRMESPKGSRHRRSKSMSSNSDGEEVEEGKSGMQVIIRSPDRVITINARDGRMVMESTGSGSERVSSPAQQHRPIIMMNHLQTFPWLVLSLIFANIGIFTLTMYQNNCPMGTVEGCVFGGILKRFSFQPLSQNPLLGPVPKTLANLGALPTSLAKAKMNQGWHLLSTIGLNAGLFHLLANLLALISIGVRLELAFGWVKVGAIYFLGGVGGSLVSAVFSRGRTGLQVDSSSAVFALLGAMAAEFSLNWSIYTNHVLHLSKLTAMSTLLLGMGLLPLVDNVAHVGGGIAGGLLGAILLAKPPLGWLERQYLSAQALAMKSRHSLLQGVVRVISFNLLVGFYATFAVLFFRGGVDLFNKCAWCHYFDCIPTTLWTCNAS